MQDQKKLQGTYPILSSPHVTFYFKNSEIELMNVLHRNGSLLLAHSHVAFINAPLKLSLYPTLWSMVWLA